MYINVDVLNTIHLNSDSKVSIPSGTKNTISLKSLLRKIHFFINFVFQFHLCIILLHIAYGNMSSNVLLNCFLLIHCES